MNVQLVTRQGLPAPAPIKTDANGKPYCEIDIACPLCGGTGETRWKSDPVCERCDGTGTAGRADKIPLFTLEHVQALDAALQAKKDRQEAERRQRWETLAQTHAALLERARAIADGNSFVSSILETVERTATLSDPQAATLERAIAQHQAGLNTRHAGTIGQAFHATVTITSVQTLKPRSRKKAAAPSRAVSMTDQDGNQLVAFGAFTCAPGQTAILSGTVKEHRTWKGAKQTLIAKAKLKAD